MESAEHAAVGAMVAAATVRLAGGGRSLSSAVLWAYGVAISVLIDVDHFPIARVLVGDWRHLRRVLADPALLVVGQDRIFDVDFHRTRLLSHLVIGGGLVAALRRRAPPAAAVTAACLGVHVLADVLRDRGAI